MAVGDQTPAGHATGLLIWSDLHRSVAKVCLNAIRSVQMRQRLAQVSQKAFSARALLDSPDVYVLQLSAISALRSLIDDVHFFENEFEEFLGPCLHFLFQFLYKATNFESQVNLTSHVSIRSEPDKRCPRDAEYCW